MTIQNKSKITKYRRQYQYYMTIGEMLDCIRDISDEIDQCEDRDCVEWVKSALLSVRMSLINHSLEEGVLPRSESHDGDDKYMTKRKKYRNLEQEVEDMWSVIDNLSCRQKAE